ncbi:WD40 repeat-like protein [Phellopilus nigrolimitatus]|nr:WD40 repeat-like protein [Phellopilus nigrolimitatus]
MIQTALIQGAHDDLVTDACYDMYGLCLATCGLDQRIKIWTLDEASGDWGLDDDWKAHDAAPTKLAWAHPAFGAILASASLDRTVKIWEQVLADAAEPGAPAGAPHWVERAVLLEARGSVRAVEFAPHHFGLKLAAVSADNHLRVYECLEQPARAAWELADEVDVPALPARAARGPASLAGTLAASTPTRAGGGGGGGAGLDGASVAGLLQAAAAAQQPAAGRPGLGAREADGGWCVSWCRERYWGEVLAVGCGVGGVVKIIQFSAPRRAQTLLSLEPAPAAPSAAAPAMAGRGGGAGAGRMPGGYSAAAGGSGSGSGSGGEAAYAVTSVAWAPSCGRSFHLVATGSHDGHVRVWKVRPPPLAPAGGDDDERDGGVGSDEQWSAGLVAEFDDHKSSVGRVEWNVTGTVLSSSGNDGRVRLWKQTVGGVWRTAGHISVEQAAEQRPQPPARDVEMDESADAAAD